MVSTVRLSDVKKIPYHCNNLMEFSGCGFKSHPRQISKATSKMPALLNMSIFEFGEFLLLYIQDISLYLLLLIIISSNLFHVDDK